MTGKQPYDLYEDRRKYPRIVIDCPVLIRYEGRTLAARIHDLSPDGLQIRCDRPTLQHIRPSGQSIKHDDALLLEVIFTLEIGGESCTVEVGVQVYYFVLLPGEEKEDVAIGVNFVSFAGRGERTVQEFIVEIMTPVEDKILALLEEPLSREEIAKKIGVQGRDIGQTLGRLIDNGDVVVMGSGPERKHVRLAAAIGRLLDKAEAFEQRLDRLEKAAGLKSN